VGVAHWVIGSQVVGEGRKSGAWMFVGLGTFKPETKNRVKISVFFVFGLVCAIFGYQLRIWFYEQTES
jgi:hypothetical protein